MASATQTRSAAAAPGTAGHQPPSGPSAAPRARSRPGHIGPFRLQQLVLVEIAAALLLVARVTEPLLLAPAALVAALLVLLAVARRRGRSLPKWLATAAALRARTRAAAPAALPPGTEPGLAPLLECDPALRAHTYAEGERRPVGMIGDGTFLTALLRIESDGTALRPDREARPLPVALVRDALDVDGIRLESAQIVQHTQPAPAPDLPGQSLIARNYLPLPGGTGAPAVRVTWVALKLDPELCPEAVAARGGGARGARKCLVRAADQLASRLTGAGFGATVLTGEELTAAITTSLCADPLAVVRAGREGPAGRRTEETARTWRCDGRPHTTYWIGRWPRLGAGGVSLPQLVARLTATPALATTFSLTLGGGDRREATVTGYVRVAARGAEELVAARHELERIAREAGTGLVRLDREQLPALLATLPLGGAR